MKVGLLDSIGRINAFSDDAAKYICEKLVDEANAGKLNLLYEVSHTNGTKLPAIDVKCTQMPGKFTFFMEKHYEEYKAKHLSVEEAVSPLLPEIIAQLQEYEKQVQKDIAEWTWDGKASAKEDTYEDEPGREGDDYDDL